MSSDMSLYLKEVNIQKSISFIQRYLFCILLRATQVLSNMNYVLSFLTFKLKRFFSDVITKHKLKTKWKQTARGYGYPLFSPLYEKYESIVQAGKIFISGHERLLICISGYFKLAIFKGP